MDQLPYPHGSHELHRQAPSEDSTGRRRSWNADRLVSAQSTGLDGAESPKKVSMLQQAAQETKRLQRKAGSYAPNSSMGSGRFNPALKVSL